MVAGNFVFADDTDGQNSLLDQILSAILAQVQSPSSHPAVQFEVSGVQIASCNELNTSSFSVTTNPDGLVIYSGSIGGTIHSVVVTEDAFELEGIYTGINQSCIDDLRNFPALFSVNGDCGLGSTVTVRTEGGVQASFTTNVACIP